MAVAKFTHRFFLSRLTEEELRGLERYGMNCLTLSSTKLGCWLAAAATTELMRRTLNLRPNCERIYPAPISPRFWEWKRDDLATALRAIMIAKHLDDPRFRTLFTALAAHVLVEVELRLKRRRRKSEPKARII